MCFECRSNPCVFGCPNYKRKREVFRCVGCMEGIYKGEEYVVISGGYYHKACANELSVSDVLKGFGVNSEVCEN